MVFAGSLFSRRRGSGRAVAACAARIRGAIAALITTVAAFVVTAAPVSTEAAEAQPWVVYYSDTAPSSAFEPYRLIVLDSHHHPPLRPLSDRGKTLLGYLSLGEVNEGRDYFVEVKAQGFLLQEN